MRVVFYFDGHMIFFCLLICGLRIVNYMLLNAVYSCYIPSEYHKILSSHPMDIKEDGTYFVYVLL